jgi:hypothetical protein
MYRHTERQFGFLLDPAPNDVNVNRLIEVQLLLITGPNTEDYRIFGPKFSAGQIDALIHVLNHAKKVLDTGARKTPEGYWPHRALF